MLKEIHVSEGAFIACNSLHGRGKQPEQIAELRAFYKRCREGEVPVPDLPDVNVMLTS